MLVGYDEFYFFRCSMYIIVRDQAIQRFSHIISPLSMQWLVFQNMKGQNRVFITRNLNAILNDSKTKQTPARGSKPKYYKKKKKKTGSAVALCFKKSPQNQTLTNKVIAHNGQLRT